MTYITDILFWISTGLLVPVMVILIGLFLYALLLLGNFFGQYLSVRKVEALVRAPFAQLKSHDVTELERVVPSQSRSPFLQCLRAILDSKDDSAHMEYLLGEFEVTVDRNLSGAKMLAKLGPILGLMGTLIPMGPALVNLSSGDIASMAYNMQVAFATTVIGLFAGAVGIVTMHLRRRWFAQDSNRLTFVVDTLTEEEK